MLRGFRFAVFALGLAALSLEIQAQPHEGATQRNQGEEQPIAQANAPAVNVVEDHPSADTSDTPEDRAEQREIDDLAAQQGMNEATQRMADLAMYQTWLIALGTLLLFVTLWLTRQANRAALAASKASADAVNVATATLAHQDDMMKRQLRAYISASPKVLGDVRVDRPPKIVVKIENTGASTALNCDFWCQILLQDYPLPENFEFPVMKYEASKGRANIGARESIELTFRAHQPLFANLIDDLRSGEGAKLFLFLIVRYFDIFREPHFTKLCVSTGDEGVPEPGDDVDFGFHFSDQHNSTDEYDNWPAGSYPG